MHAFKGVFHLVPITAFSRVPVVHVVKAGPLVVNPKSTIHSHHCMPLTVNFSSFGNIQFFKKNP